MKCNFTIKSDKLCKASGAHFTMVVKIFEWAGYYGIIGFDTNSKDYCGFRLRFQVEMSGVKL